ncbi:MAG: winged helix-turn-helix transcriptional regulator [Candidatus Lokiarchaeota archaeon]|nr:winged helix-turn-helix transcriptional regulator [Candidatus Lokiarchaeota archaeon]
MTDLLEQLPRIFKALADPTRLKIFRLLMFNDEDKLKVIDLAAKIGISQPAATQHINILKEHNLIKSKREQNIKYYYIDKQEFNRLKELLNNALDISLMKCTFKGKCIDCPRNKDREK